jgi:hypothetical protein
MVASRPTLDGVSPNRVSQIRAQLAYSVAYLEARKRESNLMEFGVVERCDAAVRLSPHGVLDLFCRSLRVWRRLSEEIRRNVFPLRRGQREMFIPTPTKSVCWNRDAVPQSSQMRRQWSSGSAASAVESHSGHRGSSSIARQPRRDE